MGCGEKRGVGREKEREDRLTTEPVAQYCSSLHLHLSQDMQASTMHPTPACVFGGGVRQLCIRRRRLLM